MSRLFVFNTFVLALAVSACGSDDGMAPDGGTGPLDAGGCAVVATYTSLHDNMLSTGSCAVGGCHAGANAAGGLNLTGGTDAVLARLVDVDTTDQTASQLKRVVSNSSAQSYLYVKIAELNPGGASGRMPPGGTGLPQCQIDALKQWIDDGAAND